MDFIVGLPRTQKGYNSIWVVVDCLTKVAHFIPVNTTYSGAKLADLYISRIVCLHGVPKKIISDRGSQFTSRFWEQLHDSLDTKLRFSTAYHPQTDGQTERGEEREPVQRHFDGCCEASRKHISRKFCTLGKSLMCFAGSKKNAILLRRRRGARTPV